MRSPANDRTRGIARSIAQSRSRSPLARRARRFVALPGSCLDGPPEPAYARLPKAVGSWRTMRMRQLGVALLIAFCSVAGARLSAQLQTGRLLGTVLDGQHAAVPGATVTVTNLATNISRTVTSDGEGNYVVTPLEPGIYRISASLPGFQTTVRDRVELTVGQSARVE